jgi:acyl-coenzyme A synthetase/AMP-(fatty) acid ligase
VSWIDLRFLNGGDGVDFNEIVAVDGESQVTIEEIRELSTQLRLVLPARSLILIPASNSVTFVRLYFAAIGADLVPMLLDSEPALGFLESLIASYQPDAIASPKQVNCGPKYKLGPEFSLHTIYLRSDPADRPLPPELSLLLATSGSTGSPKFVRLSHKNIASNALDIIQYLELTPRERPLCHLPFGYTFGLSVLHTHFLAGATSVVTDHSVFERGFWQLAGELEVTSLAGVPYTYEMLLRAGIWNGAIPSLRTFTQAGGRMAPDRVIEIASRTNRIGARLFVMYGQTEATARMSYLPPAYSQAKPSSIGIAVPSGRFSVQSDSDREEVDCGFEGELVFSGPNVSLGYATRREDLYLGDIFRGVLSTGDLGYRDDDGFFYITGRKSRIVKLFGRRVNLDDVENLVRAASFEVACTGADDHLTVWITASDETDDLRRRLAVMLGTHPSSIHVRSIETIPRTKSGKIAYSLLS